MRVDHGRRVHVRHDRLPRCRDHHLSDRRGLLPHGHHASRRRDHHHRLCDRRHPHAHLLHDHHGPHLHDHHGLPPHARVEALRGPQRQPYQSQGLESQHYDCFD